MFVLLVLFNVSLKEEVNLKLKCMFSDYDVCPTKGKVVSIITLRHHFVHYKFLPLFLVSEHLFAHFLAL